MPIDPPYLERRDDLSDLLVHLTRADKKQTGLDNLVSILVERIVQARSPFGFGKEVAARVDNPEARKTQNVVCFTEVPLQHLWTLCEPQTGNWHQTEPYGIAILKTWARHRGCHPVWYLDTTGGGHEWLHRPLRELVRQAMVGYQTKSETGEPVEVTLESSPLLKLSPFIDTMGDWGGQGYPKEFSYLREWRHVGDFPFDWNYLAMIFAPEEEHELLKEKLLKERSEILYLQYYSEDMFLGRIFDPRWSVETMLMKSITYRTGPIFKEGVEGSRAG
jgi:hypothetical protein